MGYIEIAELPERNEAIDEAALKAGRRPEDIRRMLNLSGRFGTGAGFLEGTPAQWAEQLAELTLTTGMSAYLLPASSAEEIQRFGEEVAPLAREIVMAQRGSGERPPAPAAAPAFGGAAPLDAIATADDGHRLSERAAWDESSRPTGPAPDPDRRYTADQQAAGRHLIDVHDALRAELTQLRDIVEQVARGSTDPSVARSFITRMTIRQNHWTLGTFCETYCRVVTQHHTLEDRSVFPHIQRSDPALAPVIERLEEEHETIADLLERVDGALAALVAPGAAGIAGVQATVDLLTDALLSHFSYEERELIEPLARHGFY
jgi:iron-sulfur cluster repair protein YtfE (RIC family)